MTKKGKVVTKEMLLVTSKTKGVLKSDGLNVSGDALVALNVKVHELVVAAQLRCVGNGRKSTRTLGATRIS